MNYSYQEVLDLEKLNNDISTLRFKIKLLKICRIAMAVIFLILLYSLIATSAAASYWVWSLIGLCLAILVFEYKFQTLRQKLNKNLSKLA